jgi:hypothetical protein
MMRAFVAFFITLTIISCEHSGYNVTEFTGDYRYHAGISEFFDCDSQVTYYVADAGITKQLQALYQKLDLKRKEDIFIRVDGYLKEEILMDDIAHADTFVPVKLLSHDINRGCERSRRAGN